MGINDMAVSSMEPIRMGMPETVGTSYRNAVSVTQAEPQQKKEKDDKAMTVRTEDRTDKLAPTKDDMKILSEEESKSGIVRNVSGDKEKEDANKKTDDQKEKKQESYYDKVMAEKAMEHAEDRLRTMGYNAKFGYNEKISRFTITLVDPKKNEVIKEIPSEQMQKMIEHLHTMKGMLLDTEV